MPRLPTHCHAVLPVMKDKSTRHSTQEQDDGQVELELLVLILVGKSVATDTPQERSHNYYYYVSSNITISCLGVGPSPHQILDLLPSTSNKYLLISLRERPGLE